MNHVDKDINNANKYVYSFFWYQRHENEYGEIINDNRDNKVKIIMIVKPLMILITML